MSASSVKALLEPLVDLREPLMNVRLLLIEEVWKIVEPK
jgi:hypothetical protein